jgi:hypothetical protein
VTSAPKIAALVGMLALVGACAKVLGIDDSGSSIEDLCACDQLKAGDLNAQCKKLANEHNDDQKFIQDFVKAGCPSCPIVSQCLQILGASADGVVCSSDPECASTHCCDGVKCCSTCHGCTGPAPHCTSIFANTSTCLMNAHGAVCPMCPASGPTIFGDACWACLVGAETNEQKCKAGIDACNAEAT